MSSFIQVVYFGELVPFFFRFFSPGKHQRYSSDYKLTLLFSLRILVSHDHYDHDYSQTTFLSLYISLVCFFVFILNCFSVLKQLTMRLTRVQVFSLHDILIGCVQNRR